jgi:BlaI family transcriptional regulator, penicillinase repressor
MPARPQGVSLAKREREIVDVLYRLGSGTASEIRDQLPGAPSDSTVRTQLRVLEEKGHVRHEEHGLRFVYMPTVSRHVARKSALKHLVDTFFEGSSASVVATLLGSDAARLSDAELDRISELIKAARRNTR